MPPLVTVFGAGGNVGRECVLQLAAAGTAVRAVVRSPERHAAKFAGLAGCEVVAGDVTDAASVEAALRGCSGVVFAASCSGYWDAEAVDHLGVETVATKAKEASVARVVLISSALVSPHRSWAFVRVILNSIKWKLMDSKFAGEEKLRRSGVSYTVLRPGRLLEKAGGGAAWQATQGDNATTGGNGIARADVAALAIAALSDEAAHRVTVEVVDAAPAAPAVEGQAGLFFKRLLKDAE
jgi:uncharacterized protein YbjT (DUF2867 family)